MRVKWLGLLLIALIAVANYGSKSTLWASAETFVQNDKSQPDRVQLCAQQSSLETTLNGTVFIPLLFFSFPKPIGAAHVYEDEFAQVSADYGMNLSFNGLGLPSAAQERLAHARLYDFKRIVPLYDRWEADPKQGKFSMTSFKEQVNRYAVYYAELAPYIADSTFYAHRLVDEPCHEEKWGGIPITREQIVAMANYSRQKLPGLPVTIGIGNCIDMLLPGDVDLPIVPYTTLKGTIEEYIAEQIAVMESNGFVNPKIIVSVNVVIPALMPADKVASNTIYACQHPNVVAVLWYQWHPMREFAKVVANDPAYQKAIRAATAACRN